MKFYIRFYKKTQRFSRLLAIDGQDISGLTQSEVVQFLKRLPKGVYVRLKCSRFVKILDTSDDSILELFNGPTQGQVF